MNSEELGNLLSSEGIGPDDGTGIQYAAAHLLDRRPHVHTLAFMANGPIYRTEKKTDSKKETSWQEHGGVYSFINKSHSLATDPRSLIF